MLTLKPDVEAGLRRLQLATTPEESYAAFQDLAKTLPIHEHGIVVSLYQAGFRVGHAESRREAEQKAASRYDSSVSEREEPKPATTSENLSADVHQEIGGPITVNANGPARAHAAGAVGATGALTSRSSRTSTAGARSTRRSSPIQPGAQPTGKRHDDPNEALRHVPEPGNDVQRIHNQADRVVVSPPAVRMAAQVVERHGARPFAFYFEEHTVADPVDDGQGGKLRVEPRCERRSGRYYLGGTLLTLADVEARGESARTLAANMRGNGWPVVIESTRGYKVTQPFEADDAIVDDEGRVIARGGGEWP